MNKIVIWEPRWHDRTVLVADHKLSEDNEIVIEHKDFPEPFYITKTRARTFPLEQIKTKSGSWLAVRAIPINELVKEELDV